MKPSSLLAQPVIALLLTCAALSAQAQTIYKHVGPDGRVVFTDKPPEDDGAAIKRDRSGRYGNETASDAELPYTLRQVASRYPVTLYTSENCAPCASGRALLKSRGIPFQEKTIRSAQDSALLMQVANTDSLPVLTIGSQLVKGFLATEWNQYLDAAGYPATSQLPRNYAHPAPTPLAETAQAPSKPGATADSAAPETPTLSDVPVVPEATPNAPPGFRF